MNELQEQVTHALGRFVAKGEVVVAVPDCTRPIDYTATLGPLLRTLEGARVTVVVALGLHRKMTDAELRELRELADQSGATLRQHDPDADLVMVRGVEFPRAIRDADLLIAVGVVEPHQYAGYSGGAKTFAVGCAGRSAIESMHSLTMLKSLGAAVGRSEDNPFQEALWGRMIGLPPLYSLLVVPGPVSSVLFGRGRVIHEMACELASGAHFLSVDEVDWMVLKVPPTKSANFYQASRAATYAALVARPAIKAGGTLMVCAGCPEGLGLGPGERAFATAIRKGVQALELELLQDPPPPTTGGAQRAYVLVQALRRARIVLIRAEPLLELKAIGIPTFDSVEAARSALGLQGDGLVISEPFHQVPVSR